MSAKNLQKGKTSLSADSSVDSVVKKPCQEIVLTRKMLLKLFPANVCRECPIKVLVCNIEWKTHPSFQCNGLKLLEKIVAATRGETE